MSRKKTNLKETIIDQSLEALTDGKNNQDQQNVSSEKNDKIGNKDDLNSLKMGSSNSGLINIIIAIFGFIVFLIVSIAGLFLAILG